MFIKKKHEHDNPNNITNKRYESYKDNHLNKKAFDKGFKDFQKGEFYENPYDDFTQSREWIRGQNAAFKMYLERNIVRERYKQPNKYINRMERQHDAI